MNEFHTLILTRSGRFVDHSAQGAFSWTFASPSPLLWWPDLDRCLLYSPCPFRFCLNVLMKHFQPERVSWNLFCLTTSSVPPSSGRTITVHEYGPCWQRRLGPAPPTSHGAVTKAAQAGHVVQTSRSLELSHVSLS